MDWIQQWQSKLNKQNGVAPLVRTGGSRHTGLAALPHRNIQLIKHAPASQIIPTWLQTTAMNFPMAFFWQIFYAGPFVRFIFGKLFPEKEKAAASAE